MKVVVAFPDGAHRVLPAPQHPPTREDWVAFQPLVTEWYQREKHTARMISEKLKCYGFIATEKMLRDRFRLWRINNKNKRRQFGRSNTGVEQCTTDVSLSVHPMDLNSVIEDISLSSTRPEQNADGLQPLPACRMQTESMETESGHKGKVDSFEKICLSRTIRTVGDDTHMRRTLTAILHWYDNFWESNTRAEWDMGSCPMFGLMNDFREGMYCVDTGDPGLGYSLLHEAGRRAVGVLNSIHPASFMHILQFLVPAKSDGSADTKNAVCRLMTGLAAEQLGPLHPITLLNDAHRSPDVLWELCDHVYSIMQDGVIRKAASEKCERNMIRLRVVFGWILLKQGRHSDLVSILEPFQDREGDAWCQADILRLLGLSNARESKFEYASKLLREAWLSLCKSGREFHNQAMVVLEDRAWLYGQMRHFVACDEVISRLELNMKKSNRAEHSRRRFVQSFRRSILSQVRRPPICIFCNQCDDFIPEGDRYFHCSTCNNGDYDMCRRCVDQGRQCSGLEHEHPLDPRVVDNARTMETQNL